MKKIISIILITIILLTGTVAYAQETTPSNTRSKITQAVSDYKAKLAEIKPLLEKIRANRTEIIKLRADARSAYDKAKSRIKELMKDKDNMTPEQIQSIKESLNVIKQDKQALGGTIGDIEKEIANLRANRRDRNIEEVKTSLNSIIDVEYTRIEELKKAIDNLNKIAAL